MKKFRVSSTEGQVKKHVSQMTEEELQYLNAKLDEVEYIRLTQHLLTNEDVSSIPKHVYYDILQNKKRRNIIEYNESPDKFRDKSRRVLVRDSYVVKKRFHRAHEFESYGDAVLCFVIDIDTHRVITAYYNFLRDEHYTLDMNRYSEDLKICV